MTTSDHSQQQHQLQQLLQPRQQQPQQQQQQQQQQFQQQFHHSQQANQHELNEKRINELIESVENESTVCEDMIVEMKYRLEKEHCDMLLTLDPAYVAQLEEVEKRLDANVQQCLGTRADESVQSQRNQQTQHYNN